MNEIAETDTAQSVKKENCHYLFLNECEKDAFTLLPNDRDFYAEILHKSVVSVGYFKNMTQNLYVTVFFVDQETMKRLNSERRGINRATDVLSFPVYERSDFINSAFLTDPEIMLGDLFISPEYCENDAITMKVSFSDHVAHMLTHGTLHLCGYDHERPDEAREMENLEKKILRAFHIADPYTETSDSAPLP